jgi:hypothetical protein
MSQPTRSTHHDSASSRREVHLAFGFIDMRKGHRRARHAGPRCAAAGALLGPTSSFSGAGKPTSSRSLAPALAFSPSGSSTACSYGPPTSNPDWRRTGTRYAPAIIENRKRFNSEVGNRACAEADLSKTPIWLCCPELRLARRNLVVAKFR